MKKILCLAALVCSCHLRAQTPLALYFGADTNVPGGTLVFQNAGGYASDSGYCFATLPGSTYDSSLDPDNTGLLPYLGSYYNRTVVFSALHDTDDGGAAPGTVIQL